MPSINFPSAPEAKLEVLLSIVEISDIIFAQLYFYDVLALRQASRRLHRATSIALSSTRALRILGPDKDFKSSFNAAKVVLTKQAIYDREVQLLNEAHERQWLSFAIWGKKHARAPIRYESSKYPTWHHIYNLMRHPRPEYGNIRTLIFDDWDIEAISLSEILKGLLAAGRTGTLLQTVETISVRHPKTKLRSMEDFKGFFYWMQDAVIAKKECFNITTDNSERPRRMIFQRQGEKPVGKPANGRKFVAGKMPTVPTSEEIAQLRPFALKKIFIYNKSMKYDINPAGFYAKHDSYGRNSFDYTSTWSMTDPDIVNMIPSHGFYSMDAMFRLLGIETDVVPCETEPPFDSPIHRGMWRDYTNSHHVAIKQVRKCLMRGDSHENENTCKDGCATAICLVCALKRVCWGCDRAICPIHPGDIFERTLIWGWPSEAPASKQLFTEIIPTPLPSHWQYQVLYCTDCRTKDAMWEDSQPEFQPNSEKQVLQCTFEARDTAETLDIHL